MAAADSGEAGVAVFEAVAVVDFEAVAGCRWPGQASAGAVGVFRARLTVVEEASRVPVTEAVPFHAPATAVATHFAHRPVIAL